MMIKPALSIVIPHLNEADNLARCLQSLHDEHEDGPDFEIIVVDNGSTDAPWTICESFPGTRLIVELMPGPGPARNAGAALAEADLIAFIDADCVAKPGWCRALIDHFDKHPETDFVGGAIGVLPAARDYTAVEAYEAIFSYRTAMLVQKQHFAPTGNMAVRRASFQKVGPFAGIARHEDRVWGHKAISLGLNLAYVPEMRVLTGGCSSFAALARRCDIQLAHDRADAAEDLVSRLRCLARAALVAASPLPQAVTVLRSTEVAGFQIKWAAWQCLLAIRLYRARRMVELMVNDQSHSQLATWNRAKPPS
jgi:glycosyltransferase involved in cell wall biosynthesis